MNLISVLYAGSCFNIIVLYNGEWTFSSEKILWSYIAKESKAMGVWKGITFVTLVDKLYEVIGVDKNRFDLELKVVYKCGGGDGIPIPPTKITTDSDLELWLEEMSYSIKNRTPLCVSILPKFRAVGEGCSQNTSFVPETDAEKIEAQEVDPTLPAAAACPPEIYPPIRNDSDNYYDWGFGAENMRPEELKECFGEVPKTPGTTPGTSSSRVRRVRIVDNAAKWSAPLFSAGELPVGTPNNLSVGSSNSFKITIGQLFENKEDLKLKLHLHAMKSNFEFKVKKSGKDCWFITCIDDNCT